MQHMYRLFTGVIQHICEKAHICTQFFMIVGYFDVLFIFSKDIDNTDFSIEILKSVFMTAQCDTCDTWPE